MRRGTFVSIFTATEPQKQGFVDEQDGSYEMLQFTGFGLRSEARFSRTFNFLQKVSGQNRGTGRLHQGRLLGKLYGKLQGFIMGYFNERTFQINFFNSNQISTAQLPKMLNALVEKENSNIRVHVAKFDSFFQSGNTHSFYRCSNKYEYDVIVSNDLNSGLGAEWFYFRYYALETKLPKIFNVLASRFYPQIQNCGVVCKETNCGPWMRKRLCAVVTVTDILLEESGMDVMRKLRLQHRPKLEGIMQISLGEPYTCTMLGKFLRTLNPRLTQCRFITNGISKLQFVNTPIQRDGALRLLILARQSPIQTYSTFFVQEILKLVSTQKIHQQAQKSGIKMTILPIINAQGVILGNSVCDSQGFPVDRLWNSFESKLINLVRSAVYEQENDIALQVCSAYGASVIKLIVFGSHSVFSTISELMNELSLPDNFEMAFQPVLHEGSIFQNLRRFSGDKDLLLIRLIVPQNMPTFINKSCQAQRNSYMPATALLILRLIFKFAKKINDLNGRDLVRQLQSIEQPSVKSDSSFIEVNALFLKNRDNNKRFKSPWDMSILEVIPSERDRGPLFRKDSNRSIAIQSKKKNQVSFGQGLAEDQHKTKYDSQQKSQSRRNHKSSQRNNNQVEISEPSSSTQSQHSSNSTGKRSKALSLNSRKSPSESKDHRLTIHSKVAYSYSKNNGIRLPGFLKEHVDKLIGVIPLKKKKRAKLITCILPRPVRKQVTVYEWVQQAKESTFKPSGKDYSRILYEKVCENITLLKRQSTACNAL